MKAAQVLHMQHIAEYSWGHEMVVRYCILLIALLCLPMQAFSAEVRTLKIYTTRSLAKAIEKHIQKDFEARHHCRLKFLYSHGIEGIIKEINLSQVPRGDMVIGLSYDSCRDIKFKQHFKELDREYVKQLYLPTAWEDKHFVPLQMAFLSVVYDKDVVVEPIHSFDDLLKIKHKIILSDPRTSIPGQSLLYWVESVYHDQAGTFWRALKPQILTITKSWSDAYSLFLRGEAPIVISYTTSELYHKLQQHKSNLVASKFDEGQYMEVLIGGVLTTSTNQELAEKLLLELLNETFQRAVVFDAWCFPVIELQDLPVEFNTHPKFMQFIDNSDWSTFKTHTLETWLEALSS